MTDTSHTSLNRFARVALILGIIGLGASVIGAFTDLDGFFQSYLFAFMFWVGLALGCFVLLLAQHVAGGSWGATIRRPLEAGTMLLPVMALLFIPIIFGMDGLYVWTHADYLESHPTVAAKVSYLNTPFFIIRSVIYFALWIVGAMYFVRTGRKQDKGNGQAIAKSLSQNAAMWLIVYVFTMTLAGVDWGMSLTPEWWSGIYSVTLMISQAITAMALIIITMVLLAQQHTDINTLLTSKRLQDLGNFLMAFTIFWAYVNFSQIIILWSNNIVETNTWYVLRFGLEWRAVGIFLLFFGFFGTFLILLSRWVKRKRRMLSFVAGWAFLVQIINVFYVIVPSFNREGFPLTWLDVSLLLGMGGVCLAIFARQLSAHPLVPAQDPRIEPVLNAKVVHHG